MSTFFGVRRLISLVAAAVGASLLLVACGSDGSDAGSGGATIAPASAPIFLSIDTDFDGEQWQRAQDLLRRFPGGRDALRSLLRKLDADGVNLERDVKPAVGPEVVVVWLDLEDDDAVVVLTQPRDEAKFRELVERGDEPGVVGEAEDWMVAAETQEVLDRFQRERGDDSLAENEEFQRATRDLPEDALATVYASGEALTQQVTGKPEMTPEERATLECFLEDGSVPPLGAALAAEDEGVRITMAGPVGEGAPETGDSALADEIPAGATSFVSVHGLGDVLRERIRCVADANEEAARTIAQLELGLGVSLDEDVLPLFAGETVLAAYPGEAEVPGHARMPVDLVVTEVEDEARAREVADKIAARASAFVEGVDVQDVTVAGVEAKHVTIRGQTSLFYGAFEGKLVVASSEEALAAVAGDADAFGESEAFTSALETADVPDATSGLVFLALSDAVEEYGGLGGVPSPEIEANLEPLRSLLLWGDAGEDGFSVEAFLQID